MMVMMLTLLFATTVNAAGLKMSKSSLTLYLKDTYTLKVSGTKGTVKWSTSNSGVATVSNGKVTAKKAGSCTVKATVGKKSVSCKINVKKPVTATYKNYVKTTFEKQWGTTKKVSKKGVIQTNVLDINDDGKMEAIVFYIAPSTIDGGDTTMLRMATLSTKGGKVVTQSDVTVADLKNYKALDVKVGLQKASKKTYVVAQIGHGGSEETGFTFAVMYADKYGILYHDTTLEDLYTDFSYSLEQYELKGKVSRLVRMYYVANPYEVGVMNAEPGEDFKDFSAVKNGLAEFLGKYGLKIKLAGTYYNKTATYAQINFSGKGMKQLIRVSKNGSQTSIS